MDCPGHIWLARGTRPGQHTKNWWENHHFLGWNFTINGDFP
jgi:hypothetical protein